MSFEINVMNYSFFDVVFSDSFFSPMRIVHVVSNSELKELKRKQHLAKICLIASKFIHDELSKNDLEEVVNSSITFDAPNNHLYDSVFCLELFHGPTLAFKDFGARFMARCMEKFISLENKNVNILVATS